MRESMERNVAQRDRLGQFFTPTPVATLLADMFDVPTGPTRVLDAGAGVGSLTAALVGRAWSEGWPSTMALTAFEVDDDLLPALKETLHECGDAPGTAAADLRPLDFIEWACEQLSPELSEPASDAVFDLAILNPPYRKLHTTSRERRLLSTTGVEATNLYAAFVALSLRLLRPGGQLVAITPRSFCNGPYFRSFRQEMLASSALRRLHTFEARDKAFRDTKVLQENVIFRLVKGAPQRDVTMAASGGESNGAVRTWQVPFERVVHPRDGNAFIHLVPDETHPDVAGRIRSLTADLGALGAAVSTGRVVDFRAREHLRTDPEPGTVPLLYPLHLRGGRVRWPAANVKKPNALVSTQATEKLLLPVGNYVLVKRFTSKEERRRVVATVLQADDLDATHVAIENHINVFHDRGAGIALDLAWGLATYLNSTVVDQFFRQFNGHTQVNATDLRSLRYPSPEQLISLGAAAREAMNDQMTIDALTEGAVPGLG